jgi:hypothetical protein
MTIHARVPTEILSERRHITQRGVATAEVVRDFPLSLKGSAAEAKIVSARRRCNGREATARLSNQHDMRCQTLHPQFMSSRSNLR